MSESEVKSVYPVPEGIKAAADYTPATYAAKYKESVEHPDEFWAGVAREQVTWFQEWDTVSQGEMEQGDVAWYVNGKLNVAYNCVDRHLKTRGDKVAILFEGDEPGDVRTLTFKELHREVCKFANVLKRQGVRKGTTVCIYMPMVPEAAITMLACARLGAPHSVVFAGFSAEALRDRMVDGKCQYLVTADEGVRAGRKIPLKETCDKALSGLEVTSVVVLRRTGADITMREGRDVWWHEAMVNERPYCPCEWMDAEDILFMLYTSGSTGKPKGIQHSTGGYLVYASYTHKTVFNVKEDDIYACVADVGWITGHSYIVYGPLCNGTTTLMFESTPLYPDAGRYWDMVQRHKINIFYTAPTAIRALMKFGADNVTKYDRSSLRILGSVGEPINPEAWRWYNDVVGDGKCYICDTFWQTETGGIVVTAIPGVHDLQPGSATAPFLGVQLALVDQKGQEVEGDATGVVVMKNSWPGQLRTIYGDHNRFLNVYMNPYPGNYFTGDGAIRKDGVYTITGRVDDVVNVSGHRIGSAEIESALVGYSLVSESACVGIPHDVKGSSLFAYVTLKLGVAEDPELIATLKNVVKKHIGSFAKPDEIVITPALPKTRSGKIMRRLLRKIAEGNTDEASLGDISTLADSSIVETLIAKVEAMRAAKKK